MNMRKLRQDTGQAVAVVALSMVALLAFLGLGLDMSYLRYMKRQVQRAADAAAIAGAAELPTCQGTADCTAMQTAVTDSLKENMFNTTPTITTGCSPTSGNLVIAINNPPVCLGSSDPHYGDNDYVEVMMWQVEPLNFARVFGVNSETMGARSEAALSNDLIYALNSSGSPALSVGGNGFGFFGFLFGGGAVSVSTPGGIVDDSASSSDAFSCNDASTITAPYIGVVGKAGGSGRHFYRGYGGCSYPQASPVFGTSTPEYGTPANPDPLYTQQSSLEAGAPSPSNCTGSQTGTNPVVITGSASRLTLPLPGHSGLGQYYILNPGTYCGGILINNTQFGGTYANAINVTFNPGIYTLTCTGGGCGGYSGFFTQCAQNSALCIDASTSVTGNGVGFYIYGPNNGSFNIQNYWWQNFFFGGGNGVTLTAPDATTCPSCPTAWQGMLVFQNPTDTDTSAIVGSQRYTVAITGTIYLPKGSLNYANDNTVDYNLIVAQNINLGNCGQQWWTNGACLGALFFNNWWHHGRLPRSPLHGTGGTGLVE